jgi:hypothetical protein
MGIGVGLFLIAAGAILVWGVQGDAEGVNVDAVGVILMITGLVGILLGLLFWSSWGAYGFRGRRTMVADSGYDDNVVVRERDVEPRRRTRVVEHREVDGPGPPA